MRYAIYFAAAGDTPLMRLGNHWLGRDPFAGTALPQPDIAGLCPSRFHALTTDPRRYGFHGTLKAPFSLRPERTEAELVAACRQFGQTVAPFDFAGLTVAGLGRFLALVPRAAAPELSGFAAACVHAFEPLRAPLTQADLERRRASGLTPAQDRHLVAWGYPYVLDDFRFHMTLSNALADTAARDALAAAARDHFAPVTDTPIQVSSFGLYVETERNAPFKVHSLFNLTGATPPTAAARQLSKE